MSIRDTLIQAVRQWAERHDFAPGTPDSMVDAYRSEVFDEAITALQSLHDLAPGGRRAPQLAFSVGVLIGARDFPAGEKSSPDGADATPDFFRPGRTYRCRSWLFRPLALANHPHSGGLHAVGWVLDARTDRWTTASLNAVDWQHSKWTEEPDTTTTRKDGAL